MTSSTFDNAKGKAKEAVGVATDDRELENDGKLDQAGASVKDAGEKIQEKVGDAVDAVKEKLSRDK